MGFFQKFLVFFYVVRFLALLCLESFRHLWGSFKAIFNPFHKRGVDSPFLKGNYAPVRDELKAENLPMEGFLPPSLDGEFVRNGPNPQFQPTGPYHWFDGDGMLHGVRIQEGGVMYVNKFIQSLRFQEEGRAGRSLSLSLGSLANPFDLFCFLFGKGLQVVGSRFFGVEKPMGKGSGNTAVAYHDGRLLALVENDAPHHISLPYLETVGLHDYKGRLRHPFTAHPKVDPVTGELFFFGYQFQKPYVTYSSVSANGELRSSIPINLPTPVMMHDFAITENYSILMDLPLTFDFSRVIHGKPAIMFEPEKTSRFGIFPRQLRREEEIRWFETQSCYMFHTANAWEEGDEVVLIGCRSTGVLTELFESVKSSSSTPVERLVRPDTQIGNPYLYQWRFNMTTGLVVERFLDQEDAVEFPMVNKEFLGRRSRYVYLGKLEDNAKSGNLPNFEGVIKHDLRMGTKKVLLYGEGMYGGECVFVPKDADTPVLGLDKQDDEDEGYLMTFVFDQKTQSSEFWVIDAKKMSFPPLARVKLPRRVPFGFHGTWVSRREIDNQRKGNEI